LASKEPTRTKIEGGPGIRWLVVKSILAALAIDVFFVLVRGDSPDLGRLVLAGMLIYMAAFLLWIKSG